MQKLLTRWLERAGPGSQRRYAAHLLSQFDAEPQTTPAVRGTVPSPADLPAGPLQAPDTLQARSAELTLVDPLSPREVEVLQLIALGKTNQEIARQLIVAPGTVKAHTSSIYSKLDAANRTEAVARARQLGILP